MSRLRKSAISALAWLATLSSFPAIAAVTSNVSVTSEYVFRGVERESGAAVQGGLDWLADEGKLYAGIWGSSESLISDNGSELDLYSGYRFTVREVVEANVGVIYRFFVDTDEVVTASCGGIGFPSCDASFAEIYASLNLASFSAKLLYADRFFDDLSDDPTRTGVGGEDSTYLSLAYTHTIKQDLTLKGAVGRQFGDGAVNFYGDDVTDYALTLSKVLEGGFSASFALLGTNLDNAVFDDDPKFVVTLTKGFEI